MSAREERQGLLSLESLRAEVEDGDIDTVLVAMVDLQGRLVGKRFQAEFFLDSAHAETHACDYLLANDIDMEPVPGYDATSWDSGYGDFALVPDLSTLRRVPWLEGTALVLCDVVDHATHEDVRHSPRAILRRQVERLGNLGLEAWMASELELYLFDESFDVVRRKRYRDLANSSAYIEDYHLFQTTKEEPYYRAVRRGLEAAGVPVENTKGEWGPGQGEINIRYATALEMADRHVILKNAAKEIAHQQGKAVTFMAKWNDSLAGSSSHIHQSLASKSDGVSRFFDPEGPHGMSSFMRSFVAGLVRHAREMTWLLAPYVNSYKRFQAGTFAPTRTAWSLDNRTAGFRLVGANSGSVRIECRIGGADLNPYLAYAGLVAAGLAGVEEKLELSPPYAGDAYRDAELPEVPKTLREATRELRESRMLRAAFGDAVLDHLVHTAEWEQSEYDRRVTDWELQRGFERY